MANRLYFVPHYWDTLERFPKQIEIREIADEGRDLDNLERQEALLVYILNHAHRRFPELTEEQVLEIPAIIMVEDDSRNSVQHLHGNTIPLYNLVTDPLLFDILQELVQESNSTIQPHQLVFSAIFSRDAWNFGAGKVLITPNWPMSKFERDTWEEHVFEDNEISCAAFALASAIARKGASLDSRKRSAFGLMHKFQWGKTIVSYQMEDFVKQYPEYRVTIILPTMLDQSHNTYTGRDFKYYGGVPGKPTTECRKKIIYMVWDGNNHYALISSPLTVLIKTEKFSKCQWCHECCCGYRASLTCLCKEPKKISKRKQAPKKPCEYCGMAVCIPGQCWKNCKFCGVSFKYGYNHRAGQGHRCIVYGPKNESQKFVSEPGQDKNGYMLWAYDFEACLTIVPGTLKRLSYKNNTDFEYENGHLKILEVQNNRHEVNLAICQNVFNPSERYIFFGRDALKQFIDKMLSVNKGRNICVAHNASGI